MCFHYGNNAVFICGYETNCLGFTSYHQFISHNMKCVIPAPATMPKPAGRKKYAGCRISYGVMAGNIA
ncbi:hypothetical protein D5281_01975 [bacterium 1xD42-62]|uniref:Uncharacterized protein n=1 Tax=Parablautia muri TaxID=2320879 RepID=A0A9X5BCB7_9FIRM|nr:hypothetical protein [Parablautia muri]